MQQQQQQLAQFKRNLLIVPFFFFVNVVDFPEKKSNFISSNEGLLQLIKTSRPLDESQKKKEKEKSIHQSLQPQALVNPSRKWIEYIYRF